MCVPKMLGMVVGPNWTEHLVESHGYPYPASLTMLLPEYVRELKIFRLKAQATFKDGMLSVNLHREPEAVTRIVGAFEVVIASAPDNQLAVVVDKPERLALFDGAGRWVPELRLSEKIFINVFLLDRRFNANWTSDNPLVGLQFSSGYCPLAPWRVTLWRWRSYRKMVKGIS
ncbi:MAG: hypothetical protein Q8N84_01715 [bacterium]|nr:hypothetical protein [bacterium]